MLMVVCLGSEFSGPRVSQWTRNGMVYDSVGVVVEAACVMVQEKVAGLSGMRWCRRIHSSSNFIAACAYEWAILSQ